MSKTKIAMLSLLVVAVLYSTTLIRGDQETIDTRLATSSAAIYESCKMRNETSDELGLDAAHEDCAALLLQES